LDDEHIIGSIDCECDSNISGADLFKLNVSTNSFETLFHLANDGAYQHNFNPHVVWENDKGEQLIYFTDTKVNKSNWDEKADLYCYNNTSGKVAWKVSDWTSYPNAAGKAQIDEETNSLIIHGAGTSTLFSFDLTTGEQNWSSPNIINNTSNYIIADGLVLCGFNGGGSWGIDKYTGELKWSNYFENGGAVHSVSAMNGKLFVTDGDITIIDIQSGEILDVIDVKYETFMEGTAVDPENNLLYAVSSKAAYCFKIE